MRIKRERPFLIRSKKLKEEFKEQGIHNIVFEYRGSPGYDNSNEDTITRNIEELGGRVVSSQNAEDTNVIIVSEHEIMT